MSTNTHEILQNTTLGVATRAIHAGQTPDPTTGAVVTPIFMTSTFKQDGVGEMRNGYDYSRSVNPTRTAFDEQLAAVEGGAYAMSFASGLAAIDVLLRATLRPGDNVLIGNDVYGGTYRLLAKVFVPWGIGLDVVDITDPAQVSAALAAKDYAYLWVETPSNPLLNITDIAATSALAHQYGTKVVVDNTFASPILQHPLADGADAVVYSTTKYIGGHSDVVGGAVVANDEAMRDQIAFVQNSAGAVPSPFDAWLDMRGLKTLELRVLRHSENAMTIAHWLEDHSGVERVWYPGLASHPGHEIAARQMHGGFGGMISVQLDGGAEAARRFAASTEIFTLAESLGGVESLIEVPAAMTHMSVAGTTLEVPANLVRLSVGIEDVDDLIGDLEQAFAAVAG
ncbi:cystathionine gamma-synthase [Bifidobacterium pseudolongum]|uniref:cystathionine gamma-synthase n=1 Tax=Bifidobacterium pseudolongum TaxID=1694 RepID=UPI001CE13432|nr:cystathionine gamma-synthase [Bifidobacterium pseudolongum]UBY93949.1 cystathionine gamma-synthase [Bifidobacterium pseudolongum]UBZ02783.1 cystathionine gamma-synthase [Bifidobacterium pseudolongum]UBZ04354.1 cystathionine gamma-synthase [Bifidobacterium pseudolongum]UDL23367.1 cystathionine gamma-synthase [Bifidobacterium pseudolongum]